MDMINDQEFDERDQTGEKKDDLELEESENYERYQIENPELLRRVDSQQNRENDYHVDTYIELETNVVKNTKLSASESVESERNQIEHP